MSITTYNTTYYDDLNIPDQDGLTPLDKNYLRILFKPGIAVQTRELNQLQSVLQSQIDRFGESVFKSGSPVTGGIARFDDSSKLSSVDITTEDLDPGESISIFDEITNQAGLSGSILDIKTIDDNHYRVYYKVSKLSDTNTDNSNNFKVGNTVTLSGYDSDGTAYALSGNVTSVNRAVGAHISKGVFFVKGHFVYVPKQYVTYDLDVPGKFNGYVALKITEDTVDHIQDNTLLDNASGSYNYAAPGADRYSISLDLKIKTTINNDEKFITLLTINNEAVVVNNSDFNGPGTTINDKLAQRTYEESGNYEVQPFPIQISEAYNDGSNGGLYKTKGLVRAGYVKASTSEPDIEGAKNDLAVEVDPSVAYVKGYRVELQNKIALKLPKAREVEANVPTSISANMGMYVDAVLNPGSYLPNLQRTYDKYEFVYSYYDGLTLGKARVRTIETLPDNKYRIFLYDVELNNNIVIDYGISLIKKSNDSVKFNILGPIKETDNQSGLFKLPTSPVKSIDNLRFTYKKRSRFTASSNSLTVTIEAPEGGVIDSSPSNILIQRIRNIGQSNESVLMLDSSAYLDTNPDGSILTFTFGNSVINSGDTVDVICSVTAYGRKGTKTLTTSGSVTPTYVSGTDGQFTVPVYHLVTIKSGPYEIVNDGQHPAHYSYATIRYTGTNTAIKNGTGSIPAVVYEYFAFSDNADYFDCTSYYYLEDLVPRKMELQDIPKYESKYLYKFLDFRYYGTDSDSSFRAIDAYSAITFDSTNYLSRIDSLIVGRSGNFRIKQGKPSMRPKKPKIPDSAMELYTLTLAPYTFGPKDVKIEKIDNQRYTMSNIRSLDKRITNLEYYTSLSLLEKAAKDTSILTEGFERFKNGFVVDNFVGHNVGDPSNPNYLCAIDDDNNELRPSFIKSSLKLEAIESESSNVKFHDRSVTLDYTTVPYISQTFGSSDVSVNPFDSSKFVGNIKLYPSSDYWYDTKNRPKITNSADDNGTKDGLKYVASNPSVEIREEEDASDIQVLGTEWKSWDTYWGGVEKWRDFPTEWYGEGINDAFGNDVDYRTEEGTKNFKDKINPTDKNKVEKDGKTLDINVRPYIRQRYVYFHAHSLKPNTIYYPFFDGTDVSEYCYKRTVNNFKKKNNVVSKNGEDIPIIESTNQELKADSKGNVYGLFIIPNSTDIKFLTGVRRFRLSDSPDNDKALETSFAVTDYYATGLIKNDKKGIVSNAVPEAIRTEDSRDTKIDTKTNSRQKISWVDPIAQSFLINNAEGIFATSVDLFFSGKPLKDIPVEIHLVTLENGIPSSDIVPLSTVSKDQDEVDVDVSGATATTFEFEQPIYLAPGQEYAIVISSLSSKYRLYVAEFKQNDVLTNQIISDNPNAGAFFYSQNSSVWTADQTKDIKFRLHRAKFSTSGLVQFNAPELSTIEKIKVTNGGSSYESAPTVTVVVNNGDQPIIAASAKAVLKNSSVEKVVLTFDDDLSNGEGGGLGYNTSDLSVNFSGGGGSGATASALLPNIKASNFILDQNVLEISGSDESESSNIIADVTNTVTLFDKQYIVEPNKEYSSYLAKKAWENSGVSYASPVKLSSTLTTTSNYVSPVIDTDKLSLKLIANRITTQDRINKTSKYITRWIKLNQLADQLDIYFDINRPSSSCNVKVYAKFNDPSSREETDWVEIENRVSPVSMPINADPSKFSEVHYMIDRADEYQFNSFKVKIAFIGSNMVDVPRIKNFRAIATA